VRYWICRTGNSTTRKLGKARTISPIGNAYTRFSSKYGNAYSVASPELGNTDADASSRFSNGLSDAQSSALIAPGFRD